jgi:ATP-binding cassette subfamily B protein
MIAQHYGKKFTVGQVQEMTSLTMNNPTPINIITSAERLGFNSKAYSINYETALRLTLPAIIGWENYHYVVLVELTAKEACIADPDAGIKRISRKEFLKSWSSAEVPGVSQESSENGVYIAFYPTRAFLSQYEPKRPYMHFVGYILPYKFYFFEAMIAALTINVLGMASPLFTQTIIDTVIVHKDIALLNVMLVGMVLCAMLTTLASSAQSMLLAFVTARIDLRLVAEFYRHVLSLPMNFFLTRNKGDIMSRFGENQKIRNIMAGQTITVILNLMMIGVYIAMMVAYSGALTVIYLMFIPLYIGIILFFTPLLRANSNKIFLTSSQSQSQLIEALNGIEAIKRNTNPRRSV